jgi:hypothetical protein
MKKDTLTGLLFFSIGALFFLYSKTYDIGTLTDMGPGYFPTVVSFILLCLGIIMILKSIFKK